jgi:hypothetical protein
MLSKQSIINDADLNSVFSIRFATRRPSSNRFSSSPEQKKLCRNYVKELTLNPSLGKRRTFLHLLFTREGGKGDELFNLFITTQPQNEEGIEKTVIGLLDTLRYSKTEPNRFSSSPE